MPVKSWHHKLTSHPLRRVSSCSADEETLECGHKQRVKQDAFGSTHPNRRRCRQCIPFAFCPCLQLKREECR